MPELPEVETIRRALQQGGRGGPAIIGWKVKYVDLLWKKVLATNNEQEFLEQIIGQSIVRVDRRAKFLDLNLDHYHILIHLRMSGDIRVEEEQQPVLKHDRAIIYFENGFKLVFNDPRKFGRIWFVEDLQTLFGRLGPEPLESSLSPEIFYQRLSRKNRQIKPLLMDQSFIAGMGNIYTDEALFQAHLHPLRISSSIDPKEAELLLHAIRYQLTQGINRNGSSIDWVYRGGNFQNTFKVYGKNGQECSICGKVIEKIQVGQRGTHFCPTCQPICHPQLGDKEG
ncbi:MAG: bifunctional DNA-formamidopyrimidine glycosylase/DNA-(apurinic or apyrimidinic site) lyase [Anaerolineaceae bacterium]